MIRNYILLFVVLLSYGLASSQSLSEGLRAHFPFNGDPNEVLGRYEVFEVNSPKLTEDRHGTENAAYEFDGTNLITVIDSNDLSQFGDLTISAWVRVDSLTDMLGMIVSKWAQESEKDAYALAINKTGNVAAVYHFVGYDQWNSEGNYWTISEDPVELEQWHLLTYVRRKDSISVLLNDRVISKTQVPLSEFDGVLNQMQIGAQYIGSDFRGFVGGIDDVRIYERALSRLEIQMLMDIDGQTTSERHAEGLFPLTIFPNPSVGELVSVELPAKIDATKASIVIVDGLGRLFAKGKLNHLD